MFLRLMSCSMSIEQKLCKEKIFQLKSIANVIRCIDKRFAVKTSGSVWPWNSTWAIQERQSWTQKMGSRLCYTTNHIPIFSRNWYETTALWLWRVAVRSSDRRSIPLECWKCLPPLGHFAWHWARQCIDTRAFYIAAAMLRFLNYFFSWISSVAISRWQSYKS